MRRLILTGSFCVLTAFGFGCSQNEGERFSLTGDCGTRCERVAFRDCPKKCDKVVIRPCGACAAKKVAFRDCNKCEKVSYRDCDRCNRVSYRYDD